MFTKPHRHVTRIFLHCSANENETLHGQRLVDAVRAWHTLPKPDGNGWSDVGYHFLIDKAGVVMPGRPLERMPAAQYPHNARTIAICIHGLELHLFPAAALNACRALCEEINESYAGLITFHGHNEVNPHKTCPVYDVEKLLSLDRFGRMP